MGASVTHGKRLARERTRYHDGNEGEENIPIEGDCHFPSYSTVEEAVCICERHGVPRDSWPIYYDLRGEIVLDDVSDKCQRLQQHLGVLDSEILASNWFLKHVWEWVSNGYVFYVDE